MGEAAIMTPEEQELIRKLIREGSTYSPENLPPPNLDRRPFPSVAPKAPPLAPEKPKQG